MTKQFSKATGDEGEREVILFVRCPNCGNELTKLPPNFPMFDAQCTRCTFRAQVKTNNCKPKNSIFGAGFDIYEKVLKAGFLAPPLIVNFRWEKEGMLQQRILFFPFVPKKHIRKYTLSETARRANYRMFRYERLNELPNFVLYTSQ